MQIIYLRENTCEMWIKIVQKNQKKKKSEMWEIPLYL